MDIIDKFLKENEFNNIEWKNIEEIATDIFRGKGVTKNQIGSGIHPCLRYGELYTKYNVWFDKCVSSIDPSLIKNPRYMSYGDVVLTSVSENLEDIGESCAYLGKEKVIVGSDTIVFSHKQNPKYIAYVLSSKFSKAQKRILSKPGSTLVHLYASDLKKLRIPLPSLDIQEKISEILDNLRFSKDNLVQHLKEEMGKRDKQYEYYRDFILRLGGGVNLWFLFEIYQNFFFFECSLQ